MEISSIDADGHNEVLLAMTQCVHMSPEFAKASPLPDGPLPLALYDASACPESLEMTPEEYQEEYRGKVAVWLSYVASEVSCDPHFFKPQRWYKRVVEAGAIGVVSVVPLVGQHAGTYFDFFSRPALFEGSVLESLEVSEYIPFVLCANPVAEGEGVYSQDALTSFLDNWYSDPEDRVAPFNATAFSLGNVTVGDNPWIDLYQSTLYMIGFRVLMPLLYLVAMLLSLYFLYQRLKGTSSGSPEKTKCSSVSPPLVALVVHAVVAAFLCAFYAIDGWGSNLESPVVEIRLLVVSQLLLISAGTSVLVGLTFSDIRQHSMRSLSKVSPFIVRHRYALIATSPTMMCLEVASMLSKSTMSRDVWQWINIAVVLTAAVVGIWFAVEARILTKTLGGLSGSSAYRPSGAKTEFVSLQRHITLWASVASVALLTIILFGFVGTLHSYVLFRVDNWGAMWFVISLARATYTIAMIMLLKIPKTKVKETTTKYEPTVPNSNFSVDNEVIPSTI
jgi:hypothetical protein